MIGDYKEVYFNKYCKKCKYKKVSESDPNGECWECLESPVNTDSHKPINFKEASENEKQNRCKGNGKRNCK